MELLKTSVLQLLTPATLVAVAVAAVALLMVMWLLMKRGNVESIRRQQALDALDTVSAWQPQATRLLTRGQRIVYSTLCRALPEYMVLSQVPIERFIRVPTRYSYAEWRTRVGQLCCDFVVCNSASEVISVVDVRVPDSQASARSKERQNKTQRVLKAAGIPYHVWREDAVPSTSSARDAILPPTQDTPEPLPSNTIPGGLHPELQSRRMLPGRAAEAQQSDYPVPDEYIELGEDPTPSTWFDQISQSHARHAPLRSSSTPGERTHENAGNNADRNGR